jgi:G3E family GTPase
LSSPIPWQDFVRWLDRLRRTRDKRILRIKGLVDIEETPGRPLVFHAVQGIAHPPIYLDAWPSTDRRSRLVFIGRDITDQDLTAGFEQFGSAQKARMTHRAESAP